MSEEISTAPLIGLAPACGPDERHPETGLTWREMPGSDEILKRMSFFFHRRGLGAAGYFNNRPGAQGSRTREKLPKFSRPPKGDRLALVDGEQLYVNLNVLSRYEVGTPISYRLTGENAWRTGRLVKKRPLTLETGDVV